MEGLSAALRGFLVGGVGRKLRYASVAVAMSVAMPVSVAVARHVAVVGVVLVALSRLVAVGVPAAAGTG